MQISFYCYKKNNFMNKKTTLLLTGRDPVSGHIIVNILNRIDKNKFKIILILQNPAYKIVSKKNLINFIFQKKLNNKRKLLSTSINYLKKYNPDIVLANSSGPDYGIDESIICAANKKKIKSFCIQSYWGDINHAFESEPDCYLVLDNFAKKITRQKSKKKIKIIGSIRHQNYKNIDINYNSIYLFNKLKYNYDSKIFCFFGQPTNFIDDYIETINKFYFFIKKNICDLKFVYKTHPKESKKQINKIISLFKKLNIEFKIIKNIQIEYLFISSLSVVSIFSSTGYDSYQLQKYSKQILALPIYLFFNKNLKKDFINFTGLKDIPITSKDEAIVIRNIKDLNKISNFKKINILRKKMYKSTKINLNKKIPSDILINYITK